MEAVKLFNQELSSLYEIKPPISKAKMTAITKGAIRAIKYYKHVVQSVEKFIQKCRAEYKIPGLYVIDSIVRQSRHQFGAAKDVFAPRFAKNIQITFYHLYKCPEEEKSRVIRVLNLWQKNEVFTADVIQPLFDLANPVSELHHKVEEQIKRGGGSANLEKLSNSLSGAGKAGSIQVLSGSNDNELDANDHQIIATIQQLLRNHVPNPSQSEVKFNKKLLDFDYSDDEDGQGGVGDVSELTPATLETLSSILTNERLLNKLKAMGEITPHHIQQLQQLLPAMQPQYSAWPGSDAAALVASQNSQGWNSVFNSGPGGNAGASTNQDMMDHNMEMEDDIQIVDDRRRSGRSRSPSSRNDRKRSRSHRSRSRSRDRSSRSSRRRSRSREREDREKRREREKKGLPAIKKGFLSVCSTTLWVGHLSKLVADEDLSDLFGEYGVVESINLIPPRGCGFVNMNRRMDAYKALKELHKHKLHGKPITIAWAPGKGMRDKQWKDYWDVSLGVSYIPLEKLDPQVDLVALEDGGTFDEDTMPDWMKNMRTSTTTMAAPIVAAQPTMLADAAQALGLPIQAPPVDLGHPALALPPGAPPPFGLPPGAGLLAPPAGAPGILPLGPGLLQHRFGHPPPPAFHPPTFDTSQPPPGMARMPFPPPNVVPNIEGQGQDVEMEIEDQDAEPAKSEQRNSRNRNSRWGNKDSSDDAVQSRLRNLASGGPGNESNDNPSGPPRSLMDLPPWEQDRDQRRPGPGFGQQRGGGHHGAGGFEAPPRFGDFNNGPPFNRGQGEFNDNFQQSPFRGGPRGSPGGWRGGRGGGRGNFREGPMWGRGGGPGGPGGPEEMAGPPAFGSDRDQGWQDQGPWRGGRGGRDRGGRGGRFENDFGGRPPRGGFNDRGFDRNSAGGGFGNFDRERDRSSRERDSGPSRFNSEQNAESRPPPAKRERRSRWGGENTEVPVETQQPVQDSSEPNVQINAEQPVSENVSVQQPVQESNEPSGHLQVEQPVQELHESDVQPQDFEPIENQNENVQHPVQDTNEPFDQQAHEQSVQEVNEPFVEQANVQDIQEHAEYEQSIQEEFGRPIQHEQPIQEEFERPVQHEQPVQEEYEQPVQHEQPVQNDFEHPVQQSIQEPFEQAVQEVAEPVVEPIQESEPSVQNEAFEQAAFESLPSNGHQQNSTEEIQAPESNPVNDVVEDLSKAAGVQEVAAEQASAIVEESTS